MKLIICVDDNNGMMFNRRRQSKDAILFVSCSCKQDIAANVFLYYFDIDLHGWTLADQKEFKGFSHDKITREIWTR